ncbi:hypothetical protein CCACVL1_00105, partial [Corchorus capsularis]
IIETRRSLPKDLTQEDMVMDSFFTNLETELASAETTVFSQEVEEALAKVEEALNIAPADFGDLARVCSIEKAFKVLCVSDCSSSFTLNQKAESLCMEKSFKELPERVAKAIRDKNMILGKESIKLTISQSLESNRIKFIETKAVTEEIDKKIG